MITVQLNRETMIRRPMVSLPSVVAFSKAKLSAFANIGTNRFDSINFVLRSTICYQAATAGLHNCSHADSAIRLHAKQTRESQRGQPASEKLQAGVAMVTNL